MIMKKLIICANPNKGLPCLKPRYPITTRIRETPILTRSLVIVFLFSNSQICVLFRKIVIPEITIKKMSASVRVK